MRDGPTGVHLRPSVWILPSLPSPSATFSLSNGPRLWFQTCYRWSLVSIWSHPSDSSSPFSVPLREIDCLTHACESHDSQWTCPELSPPLHLLTTQGLCQPRGCWQLAKFCSFDPVPSKISTWSVPIVWFRLEFHLLSADGTTCPPPSGVWIVAT